MTVTMKKLVHGQDFEKENGSFAMNMSNTHWALFNERGQVVQSFVGMTKWMAEVKTVELFPDFQPTTVRAMEIVRFFNA